MISVTRLDGTVVLINERNIQWVESLPDTAITFLGGGRLLVRDSLEALMKRVQDQAVHEHALAWEAVEGLRRARSSEPPVAFPIPPQ